MRMPTPADRRQSPLRRHRRRRALITGCVSLLAVVTMTACSSTTQNGATTAGVAGPSITRSGAAPSGPIRVSFEVDTFPSVQGQPIPTAVDSAQGKALLKFIKQYNATLPAGGRPIEASLVSAADVLESWQNGTSNCASVLPPSSPVPDVFVPYQSQLGLQSLDCFVKAGTLVLVASSTIVPTAWLTKTPGAFLLRGTTYSGWASAVSAALDRTTPSPPKRIVVLGPEEVITMAQDLADSAYQEVVSSLQRPGRTVTRFTSPNASDDIASSEAAFALVPTKLRRIGVDALIFPGVSPDPIPTEAMAQQKVTPPAIAAPDAVAASYGYPMEQLRSLPAPTEVIDAESEAIRLRTRIAGTAEGRTCLQTIEPDGRKLEAAQLIQLTLTCDVLNVVHRAVSSRPDALSAAQTFGAALSSLGSVTLADGTTASFGSTPQLGASSLAIAAGDARCGCVIPTGESFPVTS